MTALCAARADVSPYGFKSAARLPRSSRKREALSGTEAPILLSPCKYSSPANSTLEYLDLSTVAQAFLTACTSAL